MKQITVENNQVITSKEKAIEYLEGYFLKNGVKTLKDFTPSLKVKQTIELFEVDLSKFKLSVIPNLETQTELKTINYLKHHNEVKAEYTSQPVLMLVNSQGLDSSELIDELINLNIVPVNHTLVPFVGVNTDEGFNRAFENLHNSMNRNNLVVAVTEDEMDFDSVKETMLDRTVPAYSDSCFITVECDESDSELNVLVVKPFSLPENPVFNYLNGTYDVEHLFDN